MSLFSPLYSMSNEALLDQATKLATDERRTTAQLVAAISEVDARRLHLAEGCPTIAQYCVRVLRLSEHAAYNRITAARLAKRFPAILERLEDGTLTLSNLCLIGSHLTADNCEELLDAVASKSKREVEVIVASLRPLLASPECYRLQLTISREAWDQLKKVQDLLRHSIPDGEPSRIFERAVALLLERVEKRKFGKTDRPRKRPETPREHLQPYSSRYVSASLRREVSERDQESCAFIGPNGRCGETRGLEFHHLKPFGKGGTTTATNIELRCRAHNQHESESAFGRGATSWKAKKREKGRKRRNAAPHARSGASVARERQSKRDTMARKGKRSGKRRN